MSETDISRDEATGQFTPSTDDLFGQALENAKAGFTTKPRDPPPEETGDGDPVRQAASDLAARRREPEGLSVTEVMSMTTDRPLNEARTVEQAAAEYGQARGEISRFAEGIDLSGLANDVDQARAEAVEGDKTKAKHFGFELEGDTKAESKADVRPDAKQDAPAEDQVDAATAAAIDAVEGLDETTKRALKIPQVRAAIEQQLGEVDSARQQLATERALAQQFAQASFLESFSELAGLPPQHIEAGLQQLAQQNPQRFQQAMGILNRFQSLNAAAQQEQAARAHEQHQQFQSMRQQYSRASDAALGPMTVAEKTELVEDLVNYVGECGLSREQFAREAETNLALHHPAFQRMAADAVKYQRMVKAPRAVPQGLPPVQRPGVQRDTPRSGDNSSKISALQRQLAGAKGEKAARIAGQIRTLKRAQ